MPQLRPSLRHLISAATLAAMLGAASALPGTARVRPAPPEPSPAAWVSPDSEREMAQAVAFYRAIVATGGWPTLPDRVTLRPGDTGTDVALVRRRLEIEGDLPRGRGDAYVFDQGLEEAVKRYQIRNGVEPTGVVYGITQRLMNVSADIRLRQIELNMARMREVQAKIATQPKFILMNSASFELQGIRNGLVEIASRTIVGKRSTPTPSISASLQAINLLPYWHVPTSIARAALIPAIRKDPAYLLKEHIRVYSSFGGEEIDPAAVNWWGPEAERYVFRQDPGPHNALGVLRFDMPNKDIVYMHDTPMKALFNAFERAISAGCVRLQNYLDVAEWAIGGHDGWTRGQIEDSIAAGSRTTIKLPQALPVHFIYLTAWMDQSRVQFRNDLYNRDTEAFGSRETIYEQAVPQTTVAP